MNICPWCKTFCGDGIRCSVDGVTAGFAPLPTRGGTESSSRSTTNSTHLLLLESLIKFTTARRMRIRRRSTEMMLLLLLCWTITCYNLMYAQSYLMLQPFYMTTIHPTRWIQQSRSTASHAFLLSSSSSKSSAFSPSSIWRLQHTQPREERRYIRFQLFLQTSDSIGSGDNDSIEHFNTIQGETSGSNNYPKRDDVDGQNVVDRMMNLSIDPIPNWVPKKLQQQQDQIDLLIQIVQNQVQQQQQQMQLFQQQQQQNYHQQLQSVVVEPGVEQSSSMEPMHTSATNSADTNDNYPINSNASSTTTTTRVGTTLSVPTTPLVTPLRVMLFIDGTWLYYSIHERREMECPIQQKFGRGWQHRYRINWNELPRIVCETLQQYDLLGSWSIASSSSSTPVSTTTTTSSISENKELPVVTTNGVSQEQQQQQPQLSHTYRRPIEIVRALVFTSYKADTPTDSYRYRMFEDMRLANYDVHMMETVGKSEKCVDIQLAVEMLHYATVSNPYDAAILLTGDKDFMPAMIRTRQKGCKVGLISMQRGCNRALVDTSGLRDYDVIWLENYLDRLFVPLQESEKEDMEPVVSTFTINKIIMDFVITSGLDRVSSRDLGRYLKFLRINDRAVLTLIKEWYGSVSSFLFSSGAFEIIQREPESIKEDDSDMAYLVALRSDIQQVMLDQAKNTTFTASEKTFFDNYSLKSLGEQKRSFYWHTLKVLNTDQGVVVDLNGWDTENPVESGEAEGSLLLPDDLTKNYSTCTVAELKERCRERQLAVSGKKADLLERILIDNAAQIEVLQTEYEAGKLKVRKRFMGKGSHAHMLTGDQADYLKSMLTEYIQASGGKANSRTVGRYLAANKSSSSSSNLNVTTALQELKAVYGSLAGFVGRFPDTFVVNGAVDNDEGSYAFSIALVKDAVPAVMDRHS